MRRGTKANSRCNFSSGLETAHPARPWFGNVGIGRNPISALSGALHRPPPSKLTEEHRLVGLWSTAANSFYTLDGALAARLQLKAEYWTQPELWSSDQVRDAGIALDHVAAYTHQLLHEGK